ncbi:MAG: hypothetical protein B6D72_04140 [gamma proteobacterium symbiont of Ctena orbiculata]|nr:MAG: hypothetical protein B6D72_04140 [gamma proteobacterium symbiont of Ctena orbiculata]PVV15653.1 MAG: hypothetical protein B6D82_03140 [gamma proteobacterium symbiont of Ctena orbiculata]PVV17881.1 MAG: hypothetical protein B6D74_17370 [gamma proteobacterium symbiont of Ctena orbiculata]
MESRRNWRLKASFACYTLFLIITIVFAFIYLFRSEFMPYHALAVGHSWSETAPAYQNLIIGLMKAVGGGWLSIAIAISVLLIKPIKQGEHWAYWAIPAIGLPPALINLYVAVNMALNTPASPPWVFAALAILCLLGGFVLSSKKEA